MILAFVIHIPIILVLSYFLHKKYSSSPIVAYYWPSLIVKLLAGIGVGIIYNFIYPPGEGDTNIYQNYSSLLTEILKTNFQEYCRIFFFNQITITPNPFIVVMDQPRLFFLVKLISILNFFTFSNYWINALYMSLFSFTGLWILANKLIYTFKLSTSSIVFSFFLLPSFALWSSGLLKESLVIGIIALLTSMYISFEIHKERSLWKAIMFLTLLAIGWKLKYYYFVILLLCMTTYSLSTFLKGKNNFLSLINKKLLILAILTFSIVAALVILPQRILQYLLDIIYFSYENMLIFTQGNNYFTFSNLTPTILSYLLNSPTALIAGLFRPFLWEAHGFLAILNGMENLIILFLFISMVWGKFSNRNYTISPEAFTLLLYVCITAILMAYIAPVWGTLSRYKAGYWMFFALLLTNNNPSFHFIIRRLTFFNRKTKGTNK